MLPVFLAALLLALPARAQTAAGSPGAVDPLQAQPPPPPPSPAPEDPPPALVLDPETGELSDEFGRRVRAGPLVDRLGDTEMAWERDRFRRRSGVRSALVLSAGSVALGGGLLATALGAPDEGLPAMGAGGLLLGWGVADQLRAQRRLEDPLGWYTLGELHEEVLAWQVRSGSLEQPDPVARSAAERVGRDYYAARALSLRGSDTRFWVVDGLGRRVDLAELAERTGDEALADELRAATERAQARAGVVAGVGYGAFYGSLFFGPIFATGWLIADVEGGPVGGWRALTLGTVGVAAGGLVLLGVGLPLVATAPQRAGRTDRWYSRGQAEALLARLNAETAAELGLSEVPAASGRWGGGGGGLRGLELSLGLGPGGVVLHGVF